MQLIWDQHTLSALQLLASNYFTRIIKFKMFFFVLQALQHWPNQVRLAESSNLSGQKSPSKLKRSSASKFKSDNKPGVFTQSKPFLEKDKEIVKRILKGVQLRRPTEVQSALLRRYFLELTQVWRSSARFFVTILFFYFNSHLYIITFGL